MPDTFQIGDEVSKATGYQFPGIVRSVFITGEGVRRYVVEHTESPGLPHIFSGSQLRLVARQACGWCGGNGYVQGKDSNDVERWYATEMKERVAVALPQDIRAVCPECRGTKQVADDSGGNIGIMKHCPACAEV